MKSASWKRAIAVSAAVVFLCLALWSWRGAWLGSIGTFLDTGKPPVQADVIVVLAGGWTGERVLKAGELLRAGYAPVAILDSPLNLLYGASECELAKSYAASHGYPPAPFECLEMKASSTAEEAWAVAAELRRRGVGRCLVVSVRNHLRRAERIFRRTMPEIELHFTGAEHPFYKLEKWYEKREGRKAIFYEWVKNLTEPFGI